MPSSYNPTAADMARAARLMAQGTAEACDVLKEFGQHDSANKIWQAVSGMTVRELAILHHFITVPNREG